MSYVYVWYDKRNLGLSSKDSLNKLTYFIEWFLDFKVHQLRASQKKKKVHQLRPDIILRLKY